MGRFKAVNVNDKSDTLEYIFILNPLTIPLMDATNEKLNKTKSFDFLFIMPFDLMQNQIEKMSDEVTRNIIFGFIIPVVMFSLFKVFIVT